MALVTVLNDALRSWCFSASSSIQPESVITTIVSIRAKLDHNVQAPAPELGRPSMPAPTHTLAIMLAPPMSEGDRLETGWPVTLWLPPAGPETHPDPRPLPGKGCAPCRRRGTPAHSPAPAVSAAPSVPDTPPQSDQIGHAR